MLRAIAIDFMVDKVSTATARSSVIFMCFCHAIYNVVRLRVDRFVEEVPYYVQNCSEEIQNVQIFVHELSFWGQLKNLSLKMFGTTFEPVDAFRRAGGHKVWTNSPKNIFSV